MSPTVIQPPGEIELETRKLCVFYGSTAAVKTVSIAVPDRRVVAFIGPSGCGKSTLLRCVNRMNDLIENVSIKGEMLINKQSIFAPGVLCAQATQQVIERGLILGKED